jgi:hypothetical protein
MKQMCEYGVEPSSIIAEGDINGFLSTEKVNVNQYQHSEQKTAWV